MPNGLLNRSSCLAVCARGTPSQQIERPELIAAIVAYRRCVASSSRWPKPLWRPASSAQNWCMTEGGERIYLRPSKPVEEMTDEELDEFVEPLINWVRGLKADDAPPQAGGPDTEGTGGS